MKISNARLLALLLAGSMMAAPVLAQDAGVAAAPPAQAAPTAPTAPPTQAAQVEDDLGLDDADADEAAVQIAAEPAAVRPASLGPVPNPAAADPSLLPVYRQFGELAGITALMDDFMVGLLADARMKPFFAEVDQAKVKQHLVEQFCVILGGPCTYSGRDMVESHATLQINRNNFNALVEVLQVAMDKRGIPFRAQNQLLAKLAPMHREIETR